MTAAARMHASAVATMLEAPDVGGTDGVTGKVVGTVAGVAGTSLVTGSALVTGSSLAVGTALAGSLASVPAEQRKDVSQCLCAGHCRQEEPQTLAIAALLQNSNYLFTVLHSRALELIKHTSIEA